MSEVVRIAAPASAAIATRMRGWMSSNACGGRVRGEGTHHLAGVDEPRAEARVDVLEGMRG